MTWRAALEGHVSHLLCRTAASSKQRCEQASGIWGFNLAQVFKQIKKKTCPCFFCKWSSISKLKIILSTSMFDAGVAIYCFLATGWGTANDWHCQWLAATSDYAHHNPDSSRLIQYESKVHRPIYYESLWIQGLSVLDLYIEYIITCKAVYWPKCGGNFSKVPGWKHHGFPTQGGGFQTQWGLPSTEQPCWRGAKNDVSISCEIHVFCPVGWIVHWDRFMTFQKWPVSD